MIAAILHKYFYRNRLFNPYFLRILLFCLLSAGSQVGTAQSTS
jgi:hypothetical protein